MYTTKRPIKCHIELSNFCNAACSMCGRHTISDKAPYEMKIRKDVDTDQLSLTSFKKIFDKKFFDTYELDVINMCGNRGDPITTKHLFEICEYITSNSPNTIIKMATNGGLRTKAYWAKLGQLFSAHAPEGSEVTFGIDGLKDTNHIYRQRVKFDKVMENAQSFIDNGGEARWQYLIFKHNEHQLDEAYDLSQKMGFTKFITIHTPRFAHTQKQDGKKNFRFQNKDFELETADPQYLIVKEAKDFIDSDDQEGVSCKASNQNEFYIDNKGRLLPCCWIGNSLDHMEGPFGFVRDRVMNFYDVDEMNVIVNDLTDALMQNEFINKVIPMSWNNLGKDCASHTCKNFCGKKHNLRKKTIEYTKPKS